MSRVALEKSWRASTVATSASPSWRAKTSRSWCVCRRLEVRGGGWAVRAYLVRLVKEDASQVADLGRAEGGVEHAPLVAVDGALGDENAIAEDTAELKACRRRLLVHVCAREDRRDRLEVGRD
jgi:hypothetical protein